MEEAFSIIGLFYCVLQLLSLIMGQVPQRAPFAHGSRNFATGSRYSQITAIESCTTGLQLRRVKIIPIDCIHIQKWISVPTNTDPSTIFMQQLPEASNSRILVPRVKHLSNIPVA
jgi:hypothetical protein